jgi:hypothetical protein
MVEQICENKCEDENGRQRKTKDKSSGRYGSH